MENETIETTPSIYEAFVAAGFEPDKAYKIERAVLIRIEQIQNRSEMIETAPYIFESLVELGIDPLKARIIERAIVETILRRQGKNRI